MYLSQDVSVIIPVFQPVNFLTAALESVTSQEPGEIIIVNDASPHSLDFLPKLPNLKLFTHQENRGPGAARNTGIKAAQKHWLAFIDADDLWLAGRLELQLKLAQQHKVGVVIGETEFMDVNGNLNPRGMEARITPSLAAMLVKRELGLRFALDEKSYFGEDTQFYMQLKENDVAIHRHPETVFRYRKYPQSLTGSLTAADRRADLLHVLRNSSARRRLKKQKKEMV